MKTKFLALALVAAAPFAASADDISYSHFDLAYISVDAGAATADGFALDLSYGFNDSFYGVFGYGDVNGTSTINAGAGWHMGLSDSTDFFAELAFLSVDAGAFSDDGYRAGIGLRGMVGDGFELNGRVDMVDIGGVSDTGFTVGGVYYFEQFGVFADFSSENNVDAFMLGARFTF
jgi:hypothetical protein